MSRLARKLCFLTIQLYQAIGSTGLIPLVCRFSPSCSTYAMESVHRWGVGRGMRLAFLRLLKCHPAHPGGWDPVP